MNSKKSLITLPVMLISIPVIALIAGSLVNFITSKTNYSNLIAFGGAFVSGILIMGVLSFCKIKNIFVAIIYSFLIGSCVYVVHTYGDYVSFGKEIAVEQNITDTTDTTALADEVLESETGSKGVGGYMKYVAKVGIITKSSKSHRVMKHEGADAWLEMGFDLLTYAGISALCGYYYVNDKKKEKAKESTENV
jgi:hypothetical protein